MSQSDFEEYSQKSIHFFSRHVPPLLVKALSLIQSNPTVVDVGCGDGHLVWSLSENSHIAVNSRIIGVDMSPIRVRRFSELTGYPGIVAEGHHIPGLADESVDLTISTMVLEHVPDELEYLAELARITRRGGWLYLSTVIRKSGAWYFRKAPDGRRVIDSTHLREYPSVDSVVKLLEASGFTVNDQCLTRLIFPIAHPVVRLLHAWRPIKEVQRIFLNPAYAWIEKLALPIPRYRSIELLATRRDI